jgi:hypothetical protein
MAIMRVHVEELLCQATTGWIVVLECLLLGVCGPLWLCSFMLDIKYCCFSRTRLPGHLPITREPQGVAVGGSSLC